MLVEVLPIVRVRFVEELIPCDVGSVTGVDPAALKAVEYAPRLLTAMV